MSDHPDIEKIPFQVEGTPVREVVRDIFRESNHGTPDNITPAGCLVLARKGAVVWNAWREAFPVKKVSEKGEKDIKFINYAQFKKVDFRKETIFFSNFRFGDRADFGGAEWGNGANFGRAQWGDRANFGGAEWGNWANFEGAKWGNWANFVGAKWGDRASFGRAQWGNGANFGRAQWGNGANFEGAKWGNGANFGRAQWGDRANFGGSQWGNGANFGGAKWGDWANFKGAKWGDWADFTGAQWGDRAGYGGGMLNINSSPSLESVAFSGNTARYHGGGMYNNNSSPSLVGVTFNGDGMLNINSSPSLKSVAFYNGGGMLNINSSPILEGVTFSGNSANFGGAQWGNRADFTGAQWCDWANFTGAQWGDAANFTGVRWKGEVCFDGVDWTWLKTRYSSFQGKVEGEDLFKKRKEWAQGRGMDPTRMGSMDFSGAQFGGAVYFKNRIFTDTLKFSRLKKELTIDRRDREGLREEIIPPGPVVFKVPPQFHGSELHQDSSFEGAKFPPATGDEENARAYRTLKLAFSKQQAVREEQRFFRLEMEEEGKGAQWPTRILYLLYQVVCDYGFSLRRPAISWLVILFLFAVIYDNFDQAPCVDWLYGEVPSYCLADQSMEDGCWVSYKNRCLLYGDMFKAYGDMFKVSLIRSFPLPGLEGSEEVKQELSFLEVVFIAIHKILSFALFFLAGLAIRNRFKIK